MNAVRRFLDLFRNSPTWDRDRANLISGGVIGLTALTLNSVILIMLLVFLGESNSPKFRSVAENIEFGHLLGLILLGGASGFATLLIPLRLTTVFLAPRIGRYFDQIVLTGIAPLRFLIGKALSQNLFLALCLFLLLPWLVLVLVLGGLQWSVFLADLFLVWQYCMMLAVVMLWLSLYMNEFLAMLLLISVAALLSLLGCMPVSFQPFVVTPFPALVYPVVAAMGGPEDVLGLGMIESAPNFGVVFASCSIGMFFVTVAALVGLYLGPLYGIIRDNSTFGEVIRSGDSRRKRWMRYRPHIQRPSEIAFFYQNRGDAFRRCEGLIRWGSVLLFLVTSAAGGWYLFALGSSKVGRGCAADVAMWQSWTISFQMGCQILHGITLVVAAMFFGHARNTTFQRQPVLCGWKPAVSTLDTLSFGIILVASTGAIIGVPWWLERTMVVPFGTDFYPVVELRYYMPVRTLDLGRVSSEGALGVSLAGVAVYLLVRTVCLSMWQTSSAFPTAAAFYFAMICVVPLMSGVIVREFHAPGVRDNPQLLEVLARFSMVSPIMFFSSLYGETPTFYSLNLSRIPFYVVHAAMIVICPFIMVRKGRQLRREYLSPPPMEPAEKAVRVNTGTNGISASGLTRLLIMWLVPAAVLAAAVPGHAQSLVRNSGQSAEIGQADYAGLDIQATAGWDGVVDTTAPVPFSFLVTNFSQEVLEGRLTISEPELDVEIDLGEFTIGPNSVKRFSSIQAVPDWGRCEAEFSSDERVFWRRELPVATGRDFSENLNYLLFVDDSGRALQWPTDQPSSDGAGDDSSADSPGPVQETQPVVPPAPSADGRWDISPAGAGRPVRPLTVRTWQVPQHPGPLTVAQAMLFGEGLKPGQLNDAQWDAVGRWICLGGTLFVHESSASTLDQLKQSVPMAVQPAVPRDQLMVHHCGAGSIRLYRGNLFSADDPSTIRRVAESTAGLAREDLLSLLEQCPMNWFLTRNADKTRLLVLGVFGVYTLVSGLVTMLLFRLNRRAIAIWTVSVVGLACVAAVVLGGRVRNSPGDLQWTTITQAGGGGLVQLGRINLQSAGGRNSQLTVTGRKVDVQIADASDVGLGYVQSYYEYGHRFSPAVGFPAFTWRPGLLADNADAWGTTVPITPWGRRMAMATAFQTDVPGLQVKLGCRVPEVLRRPDGTVSLMPDPRIVPVFDVELSSTLPFDLRQCTLVLAWTDVIGANPSGNPALGRRTRNWSQAAGMPVGDVFRTWSTGAIGDVPSSATFRRDEFTLSAVNPDEYFSRGGYYGYGQGDDTFLPTQVPMAGLTGAWIVARIGKSPILSIDRAHSDFEILHERHVFVQQIAPEEIPAEWLTYQQTWLDFNKENAARRLESQPNE